MKWISDKTQAALETGLSVAIVMMPIYAVVCIAANLILPEYKAEIIGGWVLWSVLTWIEVEE